MNNDTKIIEPSHFGKVAVLMGGLHAERDISLMSGNAAFEALLRQGIDAHAIDVGDDICERLFMGHYDRVFLALHGTQGEDGVIQGLLETLRLPYTGCGVTASAVAMDKVIANQLWQSQGLPTPPFIVLNNSTNPEDVIDKLGLPLAIKPVYEGSSLGITKLTKRSEFENAYQKALEFDSRVMAEQWIEGKELTVGILDGQALPVIHISTPHEFYDYDAKYFTDTTQYICPAVLPEDQKESVQQLALDAFKALGGRHWGRVDMMQDRDGNLWLLELNTIPGLTSHSLVPKAAQAAGINFDELIVKILQQTLI